jgi:hypothetical protein
MFYIFTQNNSGGYFVVNDKVCHRLFIEADTKEDATAKAEELGCYWDGVAEGFDCPCCGDRWYECDRIDLERYTADGYVAQVYGGIYKSAEDRWNEIYGHYEIVERPTWKSRGNLTFYEGIVRFKDIEEYAQYLADEYGWTTPDARIYYKDGTVKEIFSREENLKI